jgi:hypothetical protein
MCCISENFKFRMGVLIVWQILSHQFKVATKLELFVGNPVEGEKPSYHKSRLWHPCQLVITKLFFRTDQTILQAASHSLACCVLPIQKLYVNLLSEYLVKKLHIKDWERSGLKRR